MGEKRQGMGNGGVGASKINALFASQSASAHGTFTERQPPTVAIQESVYSFLLSCHLLRNPPLVNSCYERQKGADTLLHMTYI